MQVNTPFGPNELRRVRFFVIDEADRMIETGHFPELKALIRLFTDTQNFVNSDIDEEGGKKKKKGNKRLICPCLFNLLIPINLSY
jgi:hypothetical protein